MKIVRKIRKGIRNTDLPDALKLPRWTVPEADNFGCANALLHLPDESTDSGKKVKKFRDLLGKQQSGDQEAGSTLTPEEVKARFAALPELCQKVLGASRWGKCFESNGKERLDSKGNKPLCSPENTEGDED